MAAWTDAELPRPEHDTTRLLADIDRWGYCLVADALAPDETERLRDRLLGQAAAERERGITEFGNPVEPGDRVNQWVNMLTNKGRCFIDSLANNPRTRAVVGHLLGAEYLLAAIDSHITWPGNAAMQLHTDQWWLPHPAAPEDTGYRRAGDITRARQVFGEPETSDRPINPPVVVNVFFALTPFGRTNGGTRLVPGSHRSGCHPAPEHSYREAQPEVPAGTALIWEGRTWHGAGINTGNAPRVGVSTFFCAPQFRQLTNLTYGTRPEVAAGLSAEERRLFGFTPYAGLGNTGDLNAGEIVPGEAAVGALTA